MAWKLWENHGEIPIQIGQIMGKSEDGEENLKLPSVIKAIEHPPLTSLIVSLKPSVRGDFPASHVQVPDGTPPKTYVFVEGLVPMKLQREVGVHLFG